MTVLPKRQTSMCDHNTASILTTEKIAEFFLKFLLSAIGRQIISKFIF